MAAPPPVLHVWCAAFLRSRRTVRHFVRMCVGLVEQRDLPDCVALALHGTYIHDARVDGALWLLAQHVPLLLEVQVARRSQCQGWLALRALYRGGGVSPPSHIVLQDADDVSHPDRISVLRAAAAAHPHVAVASLHALFDGSDSTWTLLRIARAAEARYRARTRMYRYCPRDWYMADVADSETSTLCLPWQRLERFLAHRATRKAAASNFVDMRLFKSQVKGMVLVERALLLYRQGADGVTSSRARAPSYGERWSTRLKDTL